MCGADRSHVRESNAAHLLLIIRRRRQLSCAPVLRRGRLLPRSGGVGEVSGEAEAAARAPAGAAADSAGFGEVRVERGGAHGRAAG
jgi:hypothetical protein